MMESLLHADFMKMSITLWAVWTAWRKAIHDAIYQGRWHISLYWVGWPEKDYQYWHTTEACTCDHHIQHLDAFSELSRKDLCGWWTISRWMCWCSNGKCAEMNKVTTLDLQRLFYREWIIQHFYHSMPWGLRTNRWFVFGSFGDCLRLQIGCGGHKKKLGGPHITIVKDMYKRRAYFDSCDFIFEGRDFSVSLTQGCLLWLLSLHDPICIPLNIASN